MARKKAAAWSDGWNAVVNKNMTICTVDSLIFLLVQWTGCAHASCILKDIYFYLVDVIFGSPCNTNSICQISALIEPNLSTHIFLLCNSIWVVAEMYKCCWHKCSTVYLAFYAHTETNRQPGIIPTPYRTATEWSAF